MASPGPLFRVKELVDHLLGAKLGGPSYSGILHKSGSLFSTSFVVPLAPHAPIAGWRLAARITCAATSPAPASSQRLIAVPVSGAEVSRKSPPQTRSASTAVLKVLGVGNCGIGGVDFLAEHGSVSQAELWALDTDGASLRSSGVANKLQLGEGLEKRHHGAGRDFSFGAVAAEQSALAICKTLGDKGGLAFVVAGLGEGVGGGAGPFVAACAKAAGHTTIGVVITPFGIGNGRRARSSTTEPAALFAERTHMLVAIDWDVLRRMSLKGTREEGNELTFAEACLLKDGAVLHVVRAVTDMLQPCGPVYTFRHGLAQLTSEDVQKVLASARRSVVGFGGGATVDSALEAAFHSPFAGGALQEAQGILCVVRGSPRSNISLQAMAAGVQRLAGSSKAQLVLTRGRPDPTLTPGHYSATLIFTGLPAAFEPKAGPLATSKESLLAGLVPMAAEAGGTNGAASAVKPARQLLKTSLLRPPPSLQPATSVSSTEVLDDVHSPSTDARGLENPRLSKLHPGTSEFAGRQEALTTEPSAAQASGGRGRKEEAVSSCVLSTISTDVNNSVEVATAQPLPCPPMNGHAHSLDTAQQENLTGELASPSEALMGDSAWLGDRNTDGSNEAGTSEAGTTEAGTSEAGRDMQEGPFWWKQAQEAVAVLLADSSPGEEEQEELVKSLGPLATQSARVLELAEADSVEEWEVAPREDEEAGGSGSLLSALVERMLPQPGPVQLSVRERTLQMLKKDRAYARYRRLRVDTELGDGSYYQGQVLGGKEPDGHGKRVYLDGSVYEGSWRGGRRWGQGCLFEARGNCYTGAWEQDLKHGKGWMEYASGHRVHAVFHKGRVHGPAMIHYANGDSFLGTFVKNQRHGPGLFVRADGQRWQQLWDHGKRVAALAMDEGELGTGRPSGSEVVEVS